MSYDCCWFNPERAPLDCPDIKEGEECLYSSPRKRLIEKCIDCPVFQRDLERLADDDPFRVIIRILVDEYKEQKNHLQSLSSFLSSKSREISFLRELSLVLQTSMELDEILAVAMTAITSGKGFGMNRAFLFMVDSDRHRIVGHLGVGPRDYEEAWHIWDEVDRSNFSLTELSREFYQKSMSSEKAKFQDILEQLSVSRDDEGHIFNRALLERRPILVEHAFDNPEVASELANTLGVSHFLVMPLISRNRSIGILLADNFVTNKPISPRDMQSLQIFAFPVAFAIERASLYAKLQEEVAKQVEANRKLQEQQSLIVRMEKMAVVGRITASIAHSIRNPLAAIGGFARALLKGGDVAKTKEYLEFIVAEAKQLDGVLEEVLNYAESQHPVMDSWDVNQLAAAVADEMKPLLADTGISIESDFGGEVPLTMLDYKQISYCLQTVIRHIIANRPGVSIVELVTSLQGEDVKLCVADNGSPLSEDAKHDLMTPFTSAESMGTGSGLPLCRVIIERHGSSFEIEDRQEGGVRYCITLHQQKERSDR